MASDWSNKRHTRCLPQGPPRTSATAKAAPRADPAASAAACGTAGCACRTGAPPAPSLRSHIATGSAGGAAAAAA
jgi:hypothetical protein